MCERLHIVMLCFNLKVISRRVLSFHPSASLMSCSYNDGWPLSVSSSVIDFYGNSSECNQTSETLNTHTHSCPVDLKAVIVNVKAINVSTVDWEDLPQAYTCETLAWTLMFVLLSSSLSIILLFSSLFFRRFWGDLMRQSSDLMLSFSRSSATRILFCQQERTQG